MKGHSLSGSRQQVCQHRWTGQPQDCREHTWFSLAAVNKCWEIRITGWKQEELAWVSPQPQTSIKTVSTAKLFPGSVWKTLCTCNTTCTTDETETCKHHLSVFLYLQFPFSPIIQFNIFPLVTLMEQRNPSSCWLARLSPECEIQLRKLFLLRKHKNLSFFSFLWKAHVYLEAAHLFRSVSRVHRHRRSVVIQKVSMFSWRLRE